MCVFPPCALKKNKKNSPSSLVEFETVSKLSWLSRLIKNLYVVPGFRCFTKHVFLEVFAYTH